MNPKELIQSGRLTEARMQLAAMVRQTPTDSTARSLLFQVLLLFGEWDKAFRQLEILSAHHSTPEMGVPVFEHLFQAEKERLKVARGESRPVFVPDIPAWSEMLWHAWTLMADNQTGTAAEILARLAADQPASAGTLNGEAFHGFGDTDARLTGVIEVIEYERYLWIPVQAIRELVIHTPKTLMDLIWAKGRITTWAGLTMGCFFPVTYPLSFCADDDRIRLGRLTDWQPLGHGLSTALGQHVFQVGNKDVSLLEIGEVLFSLPDAELKGDIHV